MEKMIFPPPVDLNLKVYVSIDSAFYAYGLLQPY
jgi:hypothetical protein